jgi:hypothetical protein
VLVGLALVGSAAVGCREEPKEEAAPPPQLESPAADAPAVGGGPRAGVQSNERYSPTSAVDVLVLAECRRAQVCGFSTSNETCIQSALAAHSEIDLTHCPRGVDATALSKCAHVLRDAPCDVEPARPEACLAATLCTPRQEVP